MFRMRELMPGLPRTLVNQISLRIRVADQFVYSMSRHVYRLFFITIQCRPNFLNDGFMKPNLMWNDLIGEPSAPGQVDIPTSNVCYRPSFWRKLRFVGKLPVFVSLAELVPGKGLCTSIGSRIHCRMIYSTSANDRCCVALWDDADHGKRYSMCLNSNNPRWRFRDRRVFE
jgi:hypothetical protein